MEQMRKEFDAWADGKGIYLSDRGMYWEVWQAARALPVQDKDAERYRWLRNADNQRHEDDVCVSDSSFNTYFGNDLDAVVDAALQGMKGEKE